MTEIGFKSGNVIRLESKIDVVTKAIADTLKTGKHASSNWFVSGDVVLNVTEIEYVREVKVGQSPE